MTSSVISVEEWLAELQRLSEGSENAGMTTHEIMSKFALSENAVLGMLRRAKELGRLRVERGRRETISGTNTPVPVYSILPPPEQPAIKTGRAKKR